MKLLETRVEHAKDEVRLVGVVELSAGALPTELYFSYASKLRGFIDDGADAFVPALLVPCLDARVAAF